MNRYSPEKGIFFAGNHLTARPSDALHIAVAAINGIDIVVKWNFAHLSNPFTRILVRRIVENEGYLSSERCSPEELVEVES